MGTSYCTLSPTSRDWSTRPSTHTGPYHLPRTTIFEKQVCYAIYKRLVGNGFLGLQLVRYTLLITSLSSLLATTSLLRVWHGQTSIPQHNCRHKHRKLGQCAGNPWQLTAGPCFSQRLQGTIGKTLCFRKERVSLSPQPCLHTLRGFPSLSLSAVLPPMGLFLAGMDI